MKVCVVGSGYVGLVAAACFAEHGNDVLGVDIDQKKVDLLSRGECPIYEPGLKDLLERNLKNQRLRFTTELKEGVESSQVVFIAVGTPQDEDGSADLQHVLKVAEGIGQHMNGYKVIVDKSTVPVGTAAKVKAVVSELTDHDFDVVSNPEFLKEGAALDDFLKPDRVVIGCESERAAKIMHELYAPFVRTNNPILEMDVASAEMTKYAANAMLATRISFMNEMANFCEKVGADISKVRLGIGTDSRIGMSFLFPGIGYGGSCFPKDVQALIRTAKDYAIDLKLAAAVEEVNAQQKQRLIKKVSQYYATDKFADKTFAIWGLAFKPQTDDVREAPALTLCRELIGRGAKVQAYDPEANQTFQHALGQNSAISYFETNYAALQGADALIICTEWNEFRNPDFELILKEVKDRVIFDGRNLFEPDEIKSHGLAYYSIGRSPV